MKKYKLPKLSMWLNKDKTNIIWKNMNVVPKSKQILTLDKVVEAIKKVWGKNVN